MAKQFIEDNTSTPTATLLSWMCPYAMLTFSKIPSEQGTIAANAALQILDGTAPGDIPIVQNSRWNMSLNETLAAQASISFPAADVATSITCSELDF